MANASRPEAVCQLLWRRHAPGFDSVPEALLTLFEVATLQGWPIIMHLASDAQGKGLAPRQEGPPGFQGAELYFLLFIVLGAFIFMKLFAGAARNGGIKIQHLKRIAFHRQFARQIRRNRGAGNNHTSWPHMRHNARLAKQNISRLRAI